MGEIFGPEDPAVKDGTFRPIEEPLDVRLRRIATDVTADDIKDATLEEILNLGRFIWGPRPVGPDSTAQLPGVVVRMMVTVGDLARIARTYGSVHWKPIQGELEKRSDARNEIKKELGNLILSAVRWADDLGLSVNECVARAVVAQYAFAESRRPR